jgi:hypothetical protein
MNAKLAYALGRRLGMAKVAQGGKPGGMARFQDVPTGFEDVNRAASQQGTARAQGAAKDDESIANMVTTLPGYGGGAAAGAGAGPTKLEGGGAVTVLPGYEAGARKAAPKPAAGGFNVTPEQRTWLQQQGWAGPQAKPQQPAWFTPEFQKQLQGAGWSRRPQQQTPESQFWTGSPAQTRGMTQDMYQRYLGFKGPSEQQAWNQAMTAGLGRAARAAAERAWTRGMFNIR